MRNLTIKRTKSFVACTAKMKIYIEDATSNEITINNTPCHKIGDLKNGEEKTFQISEQSAKIFVIADKLSKNYCNEYYELPEGQEDIFLSGKNKFNLANGNAFRFDNNTSEGIAANRKAGTRKGILVLIVAAVIGAVFGYTFTDALFTNKTPEAKTFSSGGMSIELTNEFREKDIENYTVVYESKKVAVFILKEDFTLLDGVENYTPEQYADLVIQSNALSSAEIKTVDGLIHFEYKFTNPETNDTFQYFSYVYKANDAFWLIQFATLDKNVEEYAVKIAEWAKSVNIDIN